MENERRHSKKREAIRELLERSEGHPSAEMIYTELKPDYPDLSLGTVYRNLALFREEGAVISVATVDGQDRFDADTEPHAHFVCERCGRVCDIRAPLPPLAPELPLPGEAHTCTVTYYGVCFDRQQGNH